MDGGLKRQKQIHHHRKRDNDKNPNAHKNTTPNKQNKGSNKRKLAPPNWIVLKIQFKSNNSPEAVFQMEYHRDLFPLFQCYSTLLAMKSNRTHQCQSKMQVRR